MKKDQNPKMHQHKDEFGQICGVKHPVDAFHKKKATQLRHIATEQAIFKTKSKVWASFSKADAEAFKKLHGKNMKEEIDKLLG